MKVFSIIGLILLLAACRREDMPLDATASNSSNQLPTAPMVTPGPVIPDNPIVTTPRAGDPLGDPKPTDPGSSEPLLRNQITSFLERESLPRDQVMYLTEGLNSKGEAVAVEFADSVSFDPNSVFIDCKDIYTKPFALRVTVENGLVRLRYCKDDKTDVRVKFQDSRPLQVGLAVVTNKVDGKRNPIIVFKGSLGFQCISPSLSGKVDTSNQQPILDVAECRTGLDRIRYKDGDSFFSIMDRADPERVLIQAPFFRTRNLPDYPSMGAAQLKSAGVKDFATLEKLAKNMSYENLFTQAERREFTQYVDSLANLAANEKLNLNTLVGSDRFYDAAELLNRRLDPNGVPTEVVTTEEAWMETVGEIIFLVRRLSLPKLSNSLRFVVPSLKTAIVPKDASPAEITRTSTNVRTYMKEPKFRSPIELLKREVEGNSANAPAVCVDDNSSEICRDIRVLLKILLP